MNLAKTNFIIFSPKGIKEININQTLNKLDINNEIIDQVENAKFLGIELDKYLDWNTHVSKIMSRLSRGLYILNTVKNVLPQSAMKTLYYSIFHSHLTYGIVIWGSSLLASVKKKLFLKQKRAIRIIANVKYNEHTHDLFRKFNILKIDEIIQLEQAKLMYRSVTGNLPKPLMNFFEPNSTKYDTRQRRDPKFRKCNYKPLYDSFMVKAPRLWSTLPKEIKESKNIHVFTKYMKKYLSSQ